MSLPATTYNQIVENLYSILVEKSGLPQNLVVNIKSISGADVEKILSETTVVSPNVSDSFITFEILENENDAYGATTMSDTKMETIAAYELHLRIYGESCHELAQRMFAAFKLPSTAMELLDNGMKVTDYSQISSVNEFINMTRWERCDFALEFLCRKVYEFKQNSKYDTIAETFSTPIQIENF